MQCRSASNPIGACWEKKGVTHRMLKKTVQQDRRRAETGGVPCGYVEDFDEPRTMLAGCFSILLPWDDGLGPGHHLRSEERR